MPEEQKPKEKAEDEEFLSEKALKDDLELNEDLENLPV